MYLSHVFWVAGEAYMYTFKKELISYSKNTSTVKKGKAKKVQVTEQPKEEKKYHCKAKKKSYTS